MARRQKKNKKLVPKNEFRYNYTHKHKSYVFGEINGEYRSVGLTHKEYTFGKKNMPLNKNPQKNKVEPSYVRNGIISDKINNYGNRTIKNLSFSKSDFSNVKSKIRNYKKRQRKSK